MPYINKKEKQAIDNAYQVIHGFDTVDNPEHALMIESILCGLDSLKKKLKK